MHTELSTQASRGLLVLLRVLLLQVVVGVVGGERDAVRRRVGVRVELAGVEGRKVPGQTLPSQQGDVAEKLVNLKTTILIWFFQLVIITERIF